MFILVKVDMTVEIMAKQVESTRLPGVKGGDQPPKKVGNQFLAAERERGGDRDERARLDESPGRHDKLSGRERRIGRVRVRLRSAHVAGLSQ